MQIRSLKSLIRISIIGSFAKAAEQLNITLSTLSMQMKSLEDELGVEIFDRSTRPPRLTPIGRSVMEEAISLLQSEASIRELCRPSDTLVGRFRIGFVSTAAVRILPGFFERSQREAPQASFEFETGLSEILQDRVLTGQIDAAVITDSDGVPQSLQAQVLKEEAFVFAAHRGLLSDGLTGLLVNQPFFHFLPNTGIGKLIAKEMINHKRPKKAQTVVLDNLEAIMECVADGLGFTLLPEPDVQRYGSRSIHMLPTPEPVERTLVLATKSDGVFRHRENQLARLFQPETG